MAARTASARVRRVIFTHRLSAVSRTNASFDAALRLPVIPDLPDDFSDVLTSVRDPSNVAVSTGRAPLLAPDAGVVVVTGVAPIRFSYTVVPGLVLCDNFDTVAFRYGLGASSVVVCTLPHGLYRTLEEVCAAIVTAALPRAIAVAVTRGRLTFVDASPDDPQWDFELSDVRLLQALGVYARRPSDPDPSAYPSFEAMYAQGFFEQPSSDVRIAIPGTDISISDNARGEVVRDVLCTAPYGSPYPASAATGTAPSPAFSIPLDGLMRDCTIPLPQLTVALRNSDGDPLTPWRGGPATWSLELDVALATRER